ncbi:MAG: YraN family protein [Hyphomicrobiales bacterium]
MNTSQSLHKKRKAHARGRWAEFAAALLLSLKGYRILAWRFRCPVGEVDLIARRFGTLVFVEVKTRRDVVDAAYALSARQQARIIRAAQYWSARHPGAARGDWRFDVVLVGAAMWCRHVKHAFTADAVLGQ